MFPSRFRRVSRRQFLRTALTGTVAGGIMIGASRSAQAAYPVSSLNNFPWMTQYLGQQLQGDLATHCCGPTCAVMIHAYWNRFQPQAVDLMEALHWLDVTYGYKNPFFATPESQPTSIGILGPKDIAQRTNQIGQLLDTHYGLHYALYWGNMVPYTNSQSNLGNLLTLVSEGFPCMVGCSVSGGKLGTVGEKHFAVMTGFDGANLILQNPGTYKPDATKGPNEKMSLKAFDDSWATNSRIYIPAAPHWLFS